MKEFYTRFFLINTNEYYNLGFDMWINIVLLVLMPIVVLIGVGYHLVRNNTFDAINPLILLALTYLVLVILMTKLLSVFEKRLRRSDR
jgi:ABC-type arginine/histidine transport system permease subunit